MRICLAVLLALTASACGPASDTHDAPPARLDNGFPIPDRPVADAASPDWPSGADRDAADESGQLIHGLDLRPGMTVADIGAGSGYHTLRLSPAVGPKGVVYAEDIVESYISGLRREAERRRLSNIRFVVGKPDDPRLPAGQIDRAVLVHMYHEIESPYALLWNLAPAMRPGGRVGVIDLDRPTNRYGTPLDLLRCEFEAVGYRQISSIQLVGGVGYLSVFEAPPAQARPAPRDIKPCRASGD